MKLTAVNTGLIALITLVAASIQANEERKQPQAEAVRENAEAKREQNPQSIIDPLFDKEKPAAPAGRAAIIDPLFKKKKAIRRGDKTAIIDPLFKPADKADAAPRESIEEQRKEEPKKMVVPSNQNR